MHRGETREPMLCQLVTGSASQYGQLSVLAVCMGLMRSPCGAWMQVCGIGRVTERLLREVANITVCGQLISEAALLFALFSQISAGQEPMPQQQGRGGRPSLICPRATGFGHLTDTLVVLQAAYHSV